MLKLRAASCLLVLSSAVVLVVACSPGADIAEVPVADSGVDAAQQDSSIEPDGGPRNDAGPMQDGGSDGSAKTCSDGKGGTCQAGKPCTVGECPDGTPVSCLCGADGMLTACTGACPSPTADGGVTCSDHHGGTCDAGTACQVGQCDNGTPITCMCQADGGLGMCTGACPPDAG